MKAAASTALALAIAFALGDARAGTPINEHRDVSPTAQIDVSNVKGSVTVSGWDKPEVSITGTLGDGAKKLSVEGSADHLRIKVEPPDRQGWFSWGADTRMSDSVCSARPPMYPWWTLFAAPHSRNLASNLSSSWYTMEPTRVSTGMNLFRKLRISVRSSAADISLVSYRSESEKSS